MQLVKFGFWGSLVSLLTVVSVTGCAVEAGDTGEEEEGEASSALSATVSDYCSRGTFYVTVTHNNAGDMSVNFKPLNGASRHLYDGPAKRYTFVPSAAGTVTVSDDTGSKSVKVYHEVCGGDFGSGPDIEQMEVNDLVERPHAGPSGNQHVHGAEP